MSILLRLASAAQLRLRSGTGSQRSRSISFDFLMQPPRPNLPLWLRPCLLLHLVLSTGRFIFIWLIPHNKFSFSDGNKRLLIWTSSKRRPKLLAQKLQSGQSSRCGRLQGSVGRSDSRLVATSQGRCVGLITQARGHDCQECVTRQFRAVA